MKFSKLYLISAIIFFLCSCSKIFDTDTDYIFEIQTISGKPVETLDPNNHMGVIPLIIELEDYIFGRDYGTGKYYYKGVVKFLNIGWHKIREKYEWNNTDNFSVNIGEELLPVTDVSFTLLEVTYVKEGKRPYVNMTGKFGLYGPLIDGPGDVIEFTAAAKLYYEN